MAAPGMGWLAPLLQHPAIWTINRRSVSIGAAAGLFCGLLPAPFQMVSAGLVAWWLRGNAPLAVFVTLYTNPITFFPLYFLALHMGLWIVDQVGATQSLSGQATALGVPMPPDFSLASPLASLGSLLGWMLSMGWPLVIGVLTLASLLAIIGGGLCYFGWGFAIRRRRAQRLSRSGSRH